MPPVAGPAKARRERGSVTAVDAPTPPHSIEAEQAVLGGLLLDANAWDQVARAQTAGDFVEIREAGRQAAQLAGVGVPVVDLVDDLRQKRTEQANMNQEFEGDIARFKELKGIH